MKKEKKRIEEIFELTECMCKKVKSDRLTLVCKALVKNIHGCEINRDNFSSDELKIIDYYSKCPDLSYEFLCSLNIIVMQRIEQTEENMNIINQLCHEITVLRERIDARKALNIEENKIFDWISSAEFENLELLFKTIEDIVKNGPKVDELDYMVDYLILIFTSSEIENKALYLEYLKRMLNEANTHLTFEQKSELNKMIDQILECLYLSELSVKIKKASNIFSKESDNSCNMETTKVLTKECESIMNKLILIKPFYCEHIFGEWEDNSIGDTIEFKRTCCLCGFKETIDHNPKIVKFKNFLGPLK